MGSSYRRYKPLFLIGLIFTSTFITNKALSKRLSQREENEYLSRYRPSIQVEYFTLATTMTEYARRLFYLNHPDIVSDKKVFNKQCGQPDHHGSARLGCYRWDKGIYVLNMPSPLFEGLMESTMAHELLHASYERLSTSERSRVNHLLLQVKNGYHKKVLEKRLSSYKGLDEIHLNNELHSIVGTEIYLLPPELEKYYSKYFVSRKKVVALYKLHDKKIKDYDQQIKAYNQSLSQMETTIRSQREKLSTLKQNIQGLKKQIDTYVKQGGINRNVQKYNDLIHTTNQKIEKQRNLVSEHDKTFTKYNELIKSRNQAVADHKSILKMIGIQ